MPAPTALLPLVMATTTGISQHPGLPSPSAAPRPGCRAQGRAGAPRGSPGPCPARPTMSPWARCCPCRCHGGPRAPVGVMAAPVGVMAAQEAEVAVVTWCAPVPRAGGGSAR